MITLKLPYPPSVNNYWLASGHRRYISKRGKEFKDHVAWYCKEHKVSSFGGVDVEVHIVIHPRSKILMDIDNCAKAILDSVEGAGIVFDDKQVVRLVIERGILVKGGGCTVTIKKHSTSSSVNLPKVDS